jgi:hypothetical protein
MNEKVRVSRTTKTFSEMPKLRRKAIPAVEGVSPDGFTFPLFFDIIQITAPIGVVVKSILLNDLRRNSEFSRI